MFKISVSIATIPPRVRNKHLFKCIDAFLNQTYPINKIFINISKNFKRFNNLTNEEIEEIKNYNEKIIVNISKFDSPIIKYSIDNLEKIDDNEYLFIGDDDQEYNENLIQNMSKSLNIDNNAVYQNRFDIVKKGTAGIIHGFVGLLLKKSLLNNIFNYYDGSDCWVDDQLMSIYFYKEKIKIYPSLISEFNDIYKFGNREKLGCGGDLFLSPITKERKKHIRELEYKYNVFFLKKNNFEGKGEIIDVNWKHLKINKIIHYVVLDSLTENIKVNINKLMDLYPDFIFNFVNLNYYKENYDIYKLNYCPSSYINFFSDKIGVNFVNKQGGIYINRNFEINDNFDIYDLLLNKENLKFDNDKLLYFFNL